MKQIGFLILFALFAAPVFAQSTNENFPTPVVQNEISGAIAARDVGDSRLTRYFYTFFADNGDVNLEIETNNFDGDVDLFEAQTLRPLAKITIAAESQSSKNSRVVYFRQRAQVVLRIEGRTLSDEAASYRISFFGSFAAAKDLPQPPIDDEPKVAEKSDSEAVAKVNSVGTIIEDLPPKKSIEEPKDGENVKPEKVPTVAARRAPREPRKPRVVVKPTTRATETEENTEEDAAEKPAVRTPKPRTRQPTTARKAPRNSPATGKTAAKKPAKTADEKAPPAPDPLANIQLVILLKSGERVERPMSEIFNVSVDKGQITVITKGGKIAHYNLLDVQKMTIE